MVEFEGLERGHYAEWVEVFDRGMVEAQRFEVGEGMKGRQVVDFQAVEVECVQGQ